MQGQRERHREGFAIRRSFCGRRGGGRRGEEVGVMHKGGAVVEKREGRVVG